jgi:bacillithiol biosynthesis cysteine-adding enzyme BshC
MRVELASEVRLSNSPTVEALLLDFTKIAPAFEYDWAKQGSYDTRAAYLSEGGYRGDRDAVARALRQYNEALGADSSTMESIRLLAEADALTVVTGQQPGIFTGPAYSIYKAITAVQLARQQTERLGRPVVPIFWIAGEDHDWQEVATVTALVGDSATHISLPDSFDGERRSVGLAPLPDSMAEVIEEFIKLLPQTEFTPVLAEQIRAAATAGPALSPSLTAGKPTLADWFGRLVTQFFAGTGLVLVNSADPALRQLEGEFFVRAINRQEQVEKALDQGFERAEALGMAVSVERQLGNLNLFTYIDGQRLPLVGAGDHVWIRDREETGWSKEELKDRALTHPELFSTNVVLRPVVQGVLFPDLALVVGPGEIDYLGLFRDVFGALDQQMPIIYPRSSFTLVEPPLARILEKQSLTVPDVLFRLDEKRNELLEREDRLGITKLFEQFRTDFGQRYDEMVEQVLLLDQNLRFVVDENRKQIAVQVNRLEEKAQQQHRKNCEVGLRQFDRLAAHLTPGGLQERSATLIPYLAKYGPDLVLRLLEATELGPPSLHQIVYLGR